MGSKIGVQTARDTRGEQLPADPPRKKGQLKMNSGGSDAQSFDRFFGSTGFHP